MDAWATTPTSPPTRPLTPHGACNHPALQPRPQVTRGQQPAPSPHPERPHVGGVSDVVDKVGRVDQVALTARLKEIEAAVGLRDQAMQVLRTVVATSGAQDAAHTALAAARDAAATVARRAAQADAITTAVTRSRAQAQAGEHPTAAPAPTTPPPAVVSDVPHRPWSERLLPVQHQRTLDELAAQRARQQELETQRTGLQESLTQAREQLGVLPRWGRRHRREALAAAVSSTERDLTATQREHGTVTDEVTRLTDRVEQQTRARADAAAAAAAGEEFGRALRLARHASRQPATPGTGPVLWPPAQTGPRAPRPYQPALGAAQAPPDRTPGRGL